MRLILLPLALSAATAAAEPAPPPPDGPPPPLFISPMGEPFFADGGDPLDRWFSEADRDGDHALSLAELQSDAARFFATLDLNRDGEIDPPEMERYETVLAPALRVGPGPAARPMSGPPHDSARPGGRNGPSHGRRPGGPRDRVGIGLQGPMFGPGLMGVLGLRQPVAAADADFNRGVSAVEFAKAAGQRFLLLDGNRDGMLSRDELQPPHRPRKKS